MRIQKGKGEKRRRVQFNSLSGSGNVLLLTTVLLVQDQRGE